MSIVLALVAALFAGLWLAERRQLVREREVLCRGHRATWERAAALHEEVRRLRRKLAATRDLAEVIVLHRRPPEPGGLADPTATTSPRLHAVVDIDDRPRGA